MIIQCPRCSSRWRVAESSATDNPVFKCGRCHHVFPQFPGAPPAAERAGGTKARSAPPDPGNLEFIFPRRGRGGQAPAASSMTDTMAPLREIVHDPPRTALDANDRTTTAASPAALTTHPTSAPPPDTAGSVHLDLTDDADLMDERGRADPDVPGDDDAFDDEHDPLADDDLLAARGTRGGDARRDDDVPPHPSPRTLDMEAMMSASARISGFRPATRLLLSLVAGFALLALFVRANPERTEAWLGRVPLIGSALTAEPALSGRITLTDVQGGFQHLRTGRRIFVISGKATNNSLVAVERIEVEGELYATSGAVARKVISTGNKTTLKLRDLSESEITLLQNLDARQTVAPGGSVDFAIVFLEPPRDLREFSSRVLTARSTAPALNPPGRSRSPASVG